MSKISRRVTGRDTAIDAEGMNVIELLPEVGASDVALERVNGDVILVLSDGSRLTLSGAGSDDLEHFGEIRFLNGVDDPVEMADILTNYPLRAEGSQNWFLSGSDAADVICGSNGDDVLKGYKGDDTLYGGDGQDSLYGGEGNDTLYGEGESDVLYGDDGNDILDGGEGNDTLYGGAGDDTYIFGRGGDCDVVYDTQGDNALFVTQADYDNLWLKQNGNDLDVSILGTQDCVTIKDWFSNENARLTHIETQGHIIQQSDVNLLVQAMSSFSKPDGNSISDSLLVSQDLKNTTSSLWTAKT